jgi:hypothetical protein
MAANNIVLPGCPPSQPIGTRDPDLYALQRENSRGKIAQTVACHASTSLDCGKRANDQTNRDIALILPLG